MRRILQTAAVTEAATSGSPGFLVVVLTVAALAGCSQRSTRQSVEGVVTLDGKPLKGASVTFMPRGKGRPGIAMTDADGRFRLEELGRHDGIEPGSYQVVVFLAETLEPQTLRVPSGPEIDGKPQNTIEIMVAAPTISRFIVPERYGSAATSGLEAEISGPTKGLSFALTTKP